MLGFEPGLESEFALWQNWLSWRDRGSKNYMG